MFSLDLLIALVLYEGARARCICQRKPLGRMPGQTRSSRAVRPSLPMPRYRICHFI